jgi:hypothetical protein
MKIVYLYITTWKGSCVGWAKHYYGSLWHNGKRTEVSIPMTVSDAKNLNKEDDYNYYKRGDMLSRFENKEQLIRAAIKLYKKLYPETDLLIEGSSATLDPQKVLVGPLKLKNKLNDLYKQFEAYNGWGCNPEDEPAVSRISNQWEELLNGGIS